MANGRFQTWWPIERNLMLKGQWGNIFVWWPMEGSKLGAPWNVLCLVTFGRKKRSIIFHLFVLFISKDFI